MVERLRICFRGRFRFFFGPLEQRGEIVHESGNVRVRQVALDHRQAALRHGRGASSVWPTHFHSVFRVVACAVYLIAQMSDQYASVGVI